MSPRDPYKRRAGRPKPESVPTSEEIARGVKELKSFGKPGFNYRERSLAYPLREVSSR